MEEGMTMAEKSLDKCVYKLMLGALKVIPMLLAFCALLNTVLSFYEIPCDILSLIGGVSLLPLAFLYLVSYVFQFCIYHRMFLHYILLTDILNCVDFYIGIPLSNRSLFGLYMSMTGVFLFMILYFYRKERCCKQ